MDLREVKLESTVVQFQVDGPTARYHALLLPDREPDELADVCARLHNSDLQTIVPVSVGSLDAEDILAALRELRLTWLNLAGVGAGGELAWELAARGLGLFSSLVVVDQPHPRVSDPAAECGFVDVATTLIRTLAISAETASAAGRYVRADYRVIDLPGAGVTNAALASEISLRSATW